MQAACIAISRLHNNLLGQGYCWSLIRRLTDGRGGLYVGKKANWSATDPEMRMGFCLFYYSTKIYHESSH